MRFRCLEDHECKDLGHGKYEGPAGDGTHLYNVPALHVAGKRIGITEGELDGLVATVAGIPSVGVPGSQNWKDHYYRLFDDFEEVYVFGDGDEAGRSFVRKIAPNINGAIQRVMPKDLDVTSYVQEYGEESFLQFVLG